MSDYISVISRASDRYGNLLIEFLEAYSLNGLREATEEQLKQFIHKKHLDIREKGGNRYEQKPV